MNLITEIQKQKENVLNPHLYSFSCSPFLPGFPTVLLFPFLFRELLGYSFRAGMLVTSSLNFLSSKNASIAPSFLKNILGESWILRWAFPRVYPLWGWLSFMPLWFRIWPQTATSQTLFLPGPFHYFPFLFSETLMAQTWTLFVMGLQMPWGSVHCFFNLFSLLFRSGNFYDSIL